MNDTIATGLNLLRTAAPWIATAIGSPAAGAIVGGLLNALPDLPKNASADDVVAKLNTLATSENPADKLALQTLEDNTKISLQQLGYKNLTDLATIDAQVIETVNKTMQAETVAEHWPSYTWRPFIGFITGTLIFCDYFILPLAKISVPAIPTEIWLMLGGILGIASYFRGKNQLASTSDADQRG